MSRPRVWLFDLDNTLHNASASAFEGINAGMSAYIVRELGLAPDAADALRRRYWLRYGATPLGLVRHHGTDAAHFLHHTHLLPGLEQQVHGHAHDFAALRRLKGRRYILTNAPAAYTARVLGALGIARYFDGVIAIEDMAMFGHLRPKPDTRMLRQVVRRLRVVPGRCVLVEDTLVHQKAARRVGMATVWMQRWLRAAAATAASASASAATSAATVANHGAATGTPQARFRRRPVYVDRRISSLRQLQGAFPALP